MSKSKKRHSPAVKTPADRVRFILKTVFEDNQSKLAAEIGIAQPVISRVVTGVQQPGTRFLQALAQHPRVNPAFIVSGEGPPLLASDPNMPSEGWPVPIVTSLLPGSPEEYQALLTGKKLLMPSGIHSPSRYFYDLPEPKKEPLLDYGKELLAIGDLLLMEADAAAWRDNLRVLDDRLCAVRLKSELMGIFLAVVDFHPVKQAARWELSARRGPISPASMHRRKSLPLNVEDIVAMKVLLIRP